MTRISVVVVGIASTVIAIMVKSVYGLWFLCGDLVYVLLFPQLLTVIYFRKSNTYGALCGLIVGVILRMLAGDDVLGFLPVIEYPMYDAVNNKQMFPHKTMAMLISLFVIFVVSLLTDYLFRSKKLSPQADIFQCFSEQALEKSKQLEYKYKFAGCESPSMNGNNMKLNDFRTDELKSIE